MVQPPIARQLGQRPAGTELGIVRAEDDAGDPSVERGLLLWFAADVLRMAAANAVSLAVTRLRLHH